MHIIFLEGMLPGREEVAAMLWMLARVDTGKFQGQLWEEA
jgi:hypothetical protein